MDDAVAWELLQKGEYGVLSTVDGRQQPYGVPLNYVVVDRAIFMHSAVTGHKLDNIQSNPKVAFCVVGPTELLPRKFSTRYKSVIVFGRASVVSGAAKRTALTALIEKYAPRHVDTGQAYIDKMIGDTTVIRIDIDRFTGKART